MAVVLSGCFSACVVLYACDRCKIICGLIVCMGIFMFTFLFMRFFGKRNNF